MPVINENDTVAAAEIKVGDNDRLAARVAQMASADGERSGMGFAVMEAFMDDVDVVSRRDIGTRITLKKFFSEPDYSAVCDGIADSKSDLHDEKSENDSECISGRNTIEQTRGIIKAIRPSINVQNINARTSD